MAVVIPPKKILEANSNLYDEKLFPAAEIHFAWNDSSIREYLSPDVLFSIPEVKLQEPADKEEQNKQEKAEKSSKKSNKSNSSTSGSSNAPKKSGGPSWFLAGKRT